MSKEDWISKPTRIKRRIDSLNYKRLEKQMIRKASKHPVGSPERQNIIGNYIGKMREEVVTAKAGTIPNPIPKKLLKKASGQQSLTKEDAAVGFADASAPNTSNYAEFLSPVQMAKSTQKKQGKKKMKNVREAFERRMLDELSKKTLGRYIKKATDDVSYNSFEAGGMNPSDKDRIVYDKKAFKRQSGIGKATDRLTKEQVITSLDQITSILEAYKASPSLLSRTKYLVQPKLSKTLRDRLAARHASGKPKSKGYTPSSGTLGLAAARRAQMSHSKEKSPKGYPEEVKSLAHKEVADKMAHKKSPVMKEGIEKETIHWKDRHNVAPGTNIHIKKNGKLKAYGVIDHNGHFHGTPLEHYMLSGHQVKRVEYPVKESIINEISTRLAVRYASKAADDKKKDRTKGQTLAYKKVQGRHANVPTTNEETISEGEPSYVKSNKTRILHNYLKHRPAPPGTYAYDQQKKRETAKAAKKVTKEEVGTGNFSTLPNQMNDFKNANKKKPNYSARIQGKAMSGLTAKPMMGSENNNRVSEEKTHVITSHSENGFWSDKDGWVYDKKSATKYHPDKIGHLPISAKNDAKVVHKKDAPERFDEAYSKDAVDKEIRKDKRIGGKEAKRIHALLKGRIHTPDRNANPSITKAEIMKRNGVKEEFLIDGELKKFTGDSKSGLKRKYLGIKRGRTATGQPAHQIEMDPVIKTDTQLNKIVK